MGLSPLPEMRDPAARTRHGGADGVFTTATEQDHALHQDRIRRNTI